jgi:predicted acyltransferase
MPVSTTRLVSLDALRGFAMFWLIGGRSVLAFGELTHNSFIVTQLEHSTWNGFRFFDLIFPLFLFVVGCAIPYSFAKRVEQGKNRRKLYMHIIQRTLILFILGVILNGGLSVTPLSNLRLMGILQRIALCYFFASLIVLNLHHRGQVILFLSILAGYWLIMTFVPVPSIGPGILLVDQNIANYIDLKLLPGRLYQGTWDNEGILSTLPAIDTVLIGVFAGYWLRSSYTEKEKVIWLIISGICCLIFGQVWGIWFPINKSVWTSTYVLYSGGWNLVLLAFFYWLIDVKRYRTIVFPFIVIGMNAIAIYVFASFISFDSLADRLIGGEVANFMGAGRALWLASGGMILEWLFLYWLFRKNIFIRI